MNGKGNLPPMGKLNAKWMTVGAIATVLPMLVVTPAFADGGYHGSRDRMDARRSFVVNNRVIATPSVVVAPDSSGQNTTYVPLWYLMSALDALHIHSSWDNGTWNLNLPGVMRWQGGISIGNGPLSIDVEGRAVKRVRGLVARDPADNRPTTYVPLWYVMQILKSLGIQNIWTGGSWVIVFDGGAGSPSGSGTNSANTFTLALNPYVPSGVPAPTIPAVPGQTTLTLPLYSGATVSGLAYPNPYEQTPMSPYLRVGTAEYLVPANESTVEEWYQSTYQSDGWSQIGSGTVTSASGSSTAGLVFVPTNQNTNHDVNVDMSFQPVENGWTLVNYYGTDVVTPTTTPTAYIQGSISQVDVSEIKYGQLQQTTTTTITNATQITTLTNAINNLSPASGIHSMPAIMGEATLTFVSTSGSATTVRVQEGGEVFVGTTPLWDPNETVWAALQSILGS